MCPRMGPLTPPNLGLPIFFKKNEGTKLENIESHHWLLFEDVNGHKNTLTVLFNPQYEIWRNCKTPERRETPGEKRPRSPTLSAVAAFLEGTAAL